MRFIVILLMAVALGLGACSVGGSSRGVKPDAMTTAEAIVVAPDRGAPDRGAPEAVSLLGEPLFAPDLPPDVRAKREDELALARAQYQQDPQGEQNIIWIGRRLAYLGRYNEAIAVYTDGLALHPESYTVLRHRGHRSISIRRFDDAIADLSRAAELIQGVPDEIEPDGLPNARNIPTSTSHTNIYYHLGLAHYLKGEFDDALAAYHRCMDYSANNDMRCATSYWLYLILRRLGRDAEARVVLDPITAEMEIIENFAYHKLLLLYKGELTPAQVLQSRDAPSPVGKVIDDATLAYGLGAWHLVHGRAQEAFDIFHQIVSGSAWPAFGHIAAEAELARAKP